ncbi:nuclear transport factor 2 family protein [Nocardia thailandica]
MDLAERISALENIREIERLKYRYWRACDGKDPAAFRECFVRSGARIDYGELGAFDDVEPMVRIFTRIALHTVDGEHAVLDMHHGMHPDITLTGPDTATGRWTLRFRQLNLLDRTETLRTGEYDDEYRIEDGRWRMAVCRFTTTWSLTRPLPAEAVITEGTFAQVRS